jgi:benzoyl-CoA reductase/2-hydroxyglutaryl-CoA dehydratase subunit BcrC/BadD/HgdB
MVELKKKVAKFLQDLEYTEEESQKIIARVKELNQLELDYLKLANKNESELLCEDLQWRELAMTKLLDKAESPRDEYFNEYV